MNSTETPRAVAASPAANPAMWPARVAADLAVVFATGALLLAWDLSPLDMVLTHAFGTPQGFPWRAHWLTSEVMHGWARALGWVVFAALLVNVWRPWSFARGLSRAERLRWVLTTAACAALIPLLKKASATSCPWSLAEFGGGLAHYVPHWVLGVRDGGPGGCFPSGHAATAFAFIGGWFALRGKEPRAARWWLAATMLAGALLGWVQVMRGAHYLSHSMWTAWTCWTAGGLIDALAAWRQRVVVAASDGTSAVVTLPG
jgi:membrane-associated PAP2 superfamily phosphatase